MLKIKKVLFSTDFSKSSDQAFPYAVQLAQTYGAELHMLHALVLHADDPGHPEHHLPDREEIERTLRDVTETRMGETTEGAGVGELEVKRAIHRDLSPAPAILDYASENDIDVIVMGTHGRRGVRHLLMGSVAEEVVRLASCPVLTVREMKGEGGVRSIEKILVPTDFSKHAELAVDYAKALAEPLGARLVLVHAVEEVIYPEFYMPVVAEDSAEQLQARAEEHLQKTIARIESPGVEASIEVRRGRPALEIAEFAETEDADLIVMASHGLTGLRHFLLGSVTEQVIRRAPCPVLTVKAFGKSLV